MSQTDSQTLESGDLSVISQPDCLQVDDGVLSAHSTLETQSQESEMIVAQPDPCSSVIQNDALLQDESAIQSSNVVEQASTEHLESDHNVPEPDHFEMMDKETSLSKDIEVKIDISHSDVVNESNSVVGEFSECFTDELADNSQGNLTTDNMMQHNQTEEPSDNCIIQNSHTVMQIETEPSACHQTAIEYSGSEVTSDTTELNPVNTNDGVGSELSVNCSISAIDQQPSQFNDGRQMQQADGVFVTTDQEDVLMDTHDLSSDHSYILNINSVPKLHCEAKEEFEGSTIEQNFLRGCKWSPDGTCIITNSNDNRLRLFHLTQDKNLDMRSSLTMKEGSQIYDFAWSPLMSSQEPDSCRLATTCAGIPVHLWDTNKGKVVASYKAFDQYDEITAAHSLSFSLDSTKLYMGYDKTIRIFDIDCPQRPCKVIKTFDSKEKSGQRGIISCFSMSPDHSGVFAAGSYGRSIGVYDSRSLKLVSLMAGHLGGITHVMYSPDGYKLYSGGRKDSEILCWDVRNSGKILYILLRDVQTHQRMYFDMSKSGRWFAAGNHEGSVFFMDTSVPPEPDQEELYLKPQALFQAHLDCVNGVSFNPHFDMMATASGQRHFRNFEYNSSDDETTMKTDKPADSLDFSLRIWNINTVTDNIT